MGSKASVASVAARASVASVAAGRALVGSAAVGGSESSTGKNGIVGVEMLVELRDFLVVKIYKQLSKLENPFLRIFGTHAAIILKVRNEDEDTTHVLLKLNQNTGYFIIRGNLRELKKKRKEEIEFKEFASRPIKLKEVEEFIDSVKHINYHAISNNCQHFAEKLLGKFKLNN